MTNLVDHLERYLGDIDVGWSRDADGAPLEFQVARYTGEVGQNRVAFSTVGLSRTPLKSRVSGKAIHLELLMLLHDSLRDGPAPGLLQQVGRELVLCSFWNATVLPNPPRR